MNRPPHRAATAGLHDHLPGLGNPRRLQPTIIQEHGRGGIHLHILKLYRPSVPLRPVSATPQCGCESSPSPPSLSIALAERLGIQFESAGHFDEPTPCPHPFIAVRPIINISCIRQNI